MQKDPDEVLTPEEDHDVSAAGVARSTNADDCDRSASVIDDTASPPAVRCPRCDRAFSSAAHVKRHIRAVHDGERSHICEQCEKAFSLKGNLRRHVKTVHEGVKLAKKRACEHCGVKFPGLGKLQVSSSSFCLLELIFGLSWTLPPLMGLKTLQYVRLWKVMKPMYPGQCFMTETFH